MCRKLLPLLSVCLLLLSAHCYSEAYLTDEQEQELLTLIQDAQKESTILKEESEQLKTECQNLSMDLKTSQKEVMDLKTSYEEQKKYYEKHIKNESLKATIFEVLTIILAIAVAIVSFF